jgi:hypothetical protein
MSEFNCEVKCNPGALINLAGIAISIVAIYFGSQNINNPCSDSNILDLATWMIIFGSVTLFILFGSLLILCTGPIGVVIYALSLLCYGVFSLIWCILGSVILWRDSMNCYDADFQFYQVAMATVIFSIILTVFSCCCGANGSKNMQVN